MDGQRAERRIIRQPDREKQRRVGGGETDRDGERGRGTKR